ncbi:MAG: type II secretion system protein [Verrucomicrobiales bacterium]
MKTNTHAQARKGFTLVELLVVIAIIAALAGLATPVILKAQKAAAITEATNNARQIGTLLVLFDQDWGTFPSSDTATSINESTGETVPSGNDSNSYLAQLIVGGYTDSEEIFFAKGGVEGGQKPDGVVTAGEVLDAKECGFAYVMLSGDEPLSTSYNGNLPVVCAPVDADDPSRFNPSPYDNKAVYLRLDSSVQQKRINNQGEVVVGGGKKLFDTGSETAWDDLTPNVIAPKK